MRIEEYKASGGGVLLFGVRCMGEARELAKARGLSFERIVADMIPVRPNHYGIAQESIMSIHEYFMDGDCDVAYYTPLLNCLHILAAPRRWDPSFLARTRHLWPYEYVDRSPN